MDDLLKCAQHMKIKTYEARSIIEEVKNSIEKWAVFAVKANVNPSLADFVENQFITFN